VPEGVPADIFPFVRRAFEVVAQARMSSSAVEARRLGYLRDVDAISVNPDRALADAKRTALHLAAGGFQPPRRRTAVRVVGKPGLAELEVMLHQYRQAGHITEYDQQLGKSLAYVLTGGDVDDDVTVGEEYLLELELETFLKLCGEAKTQERIDHMLRTGKPLRN
jgi:3-hydroxyacyl-CoA dehydrogenase